MKLVKEFVKFIVERHSIFIKKSAGFPKPWTKNKILQQYRFCNVYREADAVTIWIREHWRRPHTDDPDLWFAMIVARLVNWPETMATTGYPVPWKPAKWVKDMDQRQWTGAKLFSGAYMVNAVGGEGRTKAAYLAERVLQPIWEKRKEGRNAFTASHSCGLAEAHNWLSQFRGMGSFMAAQVIADVKYTPMLANARDWWTWAAPGPGSLRGMSRVEFGDLNTKYTDAEWHSSLAELGSKVDPVIAKASMSRLHAQDLQNCLCEFDKYQRVLRGEGRPRSKYPGT